MVQTPIKSMSLETFLAMPETKPASEFIDGKILEKPMPQGKHSIIQRELTFTIDRPLRDKKIGRAYPELRCTFGGRSTVPDIAVVAWERIPRDESGAVANVFAIVPNWTVDIVSPTADWLKHTNNLSMIGSIGIIRE